MCDTQAHIIDDLASQHSAALRDISRARDLLADARHALDAGRNSVAAEFIDRALDHLSN